VTKLEKGYTWGGRAYADRERSNVGGEGFLTQGRLI